MKFWIFQTGEPLHTDGGAPRPMRAINLANALLAAGHSVILWSSAFSHQEKKHRAREYQKLRLNDSLEVRLIPSPGYKLNIGLGRLYDHAVLAMNLKKALNEEREVPDVGFIGYPPIEFAYVAMSWLKAYGVPAVVDAKDQWPQFFVDPFPKVLQPIVKLGFAPYFYLGRKVMQEATCFSSMSQSFLSWMAKYAKRPLNSLDFVAPLSPINQVLSTQNLSNSLDWWSKKGILSDGKKRFFFVGSFTRSFDFIPVAVAAKLANQAGLDWQFVICGDGAEAREIRGIFDGLPNVICPGWVNRTNIIALANISIAGLAPYRNIDNFVNNVPNKVIDYLSMGKLIISPLWGEVNALINQHVVGATYKQQDGENLFEVLKRICNNQSMINNMSENALNLYKRDFSGERIYQDLVDRLVALPSTIKRDL